MKIKYEDIKLDIGCADKKGKDFIGIDYRNFPGVDIVHDLEKFPWPIPNECCSFIIASHVVEHINPHKGVFLSFMDEVWRIAKSNTEFRIAMPLGGSIGYWADPTHVNGCNQITWHYFDPTNQPFRENLYEIYRPKPWKIKSINIDENSNMEVILVKIKL